MEAVTQTYTQLTKQNFELFQKGDIPAMLENMHDNVEWITPGPEEYLPWAGKKTGKKAVADWFSTLNEEVDINTFEPREFIEQGNRVAVLGYSESRIKKNNNKVSGDWVMMFTYKDGKLLRYREFRDTYEAYKAYVG